MAAPRCKQCGYVLTGLEKGGCPGCGTPFDLADPSTFSDKPLFNRFRFWLPGYLLAAASGAILYPLLITNIGFGWTVSLVLPFCLGALIGFGCRVTKFVAVLLGLILLGGLVLGLFTQQFVGVFCGLVLAGVALGPLIVGTLVGAMLRKMLKHSSWEQRWHLPTISLLFAPLTVGVMEGQFTTPYANETVSTTIVLPVAIDRAWDAVMFYEEIHLRPPFLMRIALPRPLYTRGSTESIGDIKICVYSKGRLVKRIVNRVPNQKLVFDVIEQTHIENRSMVLEHGSFEFTSLGETQTRITLATEYRPLLGPRWAWRWSERLGMHTLHGYVLAGMRAKSVKDAAHNPPSAKYPPPLEPAS